MIQMRRQTQEFIMPEIDTYSPRKRTPQNEDHLPKNYNPKQERKTFVQITLSESEIEEAVRNWIRSQVPINADDELPVVLIAGRGENGHSASVTLTPVPIVALPVDRPAEAMKDYEEVSSEAIRRNGQEPATSQQESSKTTHTSPSSEKERTVNATDQSEKFSETMNEENASDGILESDTVEMPKASSLFSSPTSVIKDENNEENVFLTADQESDASSYQEEKNTSSARKSIFE